MKNKYLMTNIGTMIDIALGSLGKNNIPDELKTFEMYYSPYYHLMHMLAAEMAIGDGVALELGVESGRGLVSLATGSHDCQVYGYDTVTTSTLRNRIRWYDNIHFENHASLPAHNPVDGKTIDILHIDTEHSFAMAKAEFEAYKPFLSDEAVVLFDDLHAQDDGVLQYFYSIPGIKIQCDNLHPVCGYGILLFERDNG